MKDAVLIIEGERYLEVRVLAEIFEVQVAWVEEVVERGLVPGHREIESVRYVRVTEFDRVAQVIRLRQVLELDWDALEAFLGP